MFTAAQITAAHSRVQSGADFPAYVKEIKQLGVTHYEAYVSDGHIDYYGANQYIVKIKEKYDFLYVSKQADVPAFKEGLLAHQKGKTDYKTFIAMCARTGIEKWTVYTDRMVCVYYDKSGNEVINEEVPT